MAGIPQLVFASAPVPSVASIQGYKELDITPPSGYEELYAGFKAFSLYVSQSTNIQSYTAKVVFSEPFLGFLTFYNEYDFGIYGYFSVCLDSECSKSVKLDASSGWDFTSSNIDGRERRYSTGCYFGIIHGFVLVVTGCSSNCNYVASSVSVKSIR